MDFLSLFSTIFAVMAFFIFLLLCIFFFSVAGVRNALKPVCYSSYNKKHFYEEFEFACEFCGFTVSSESKQCPNCASPFGNNKEYQAKKRAMYQKYLRYLKDQEEAIQKEMDYISDTMKAIQRYKWMRHKSFNFDIGEPPIYKPATDYEFVCEYCNNKMRGKSTDEKGCTNCGASYDKNWELLVREEEDRLEKRHYDQYMELKELEWTQNIKNEQRDVRVEEKYKTPIKFMEKNGKYIAVITIFVIMLIALGIAILIKM